MRRTGKKGPLFGINLDNNSTRIPIVIQDTVEHLMKNDNIDAEGIFRISGSSIQIQELKRKYDNGKTPNLDKVSSPHIVSGLLKLFLRELPEPLLSFELYDVFVAVHSINDAQQRLDRIKKVLHEMLPIGRQALLKYLMNFLYNVSQRVEANKMSAANLAIVFGPNILRHEKDSMEIMITETPAVTGITFTFIEQYHFIFDSMEIPEPPKEKTKKELKKEEKLLKKQEKNEKRKKNEETNEIPQKTAPSLPKKPPQLPSRPPEINLKILSLINDIEKRNRPLPPDPIF
ncbi:rho/rac/cdc gtpase-activating protein [Anaeramoeba ignava]|uniref:Rho/rac/cdc gtpase-activating protein n=1 Tax=Anaeramoeba ignava TaxID=1746090 RepID=A0A9Q0LUE6_ANAIG|nr:rho/rac/cdc gtpase-activating protein [Anaeramoeba ignava]